MPADPAFWRTLRQDFESLQPLGQFSRIWTSQPHVSVLEELSPSPSQWEWSQFPDESSRARLSAIALRGARALGYDSEDEWFDELRRADFVKFKITGSGCWKKPGGTVYEWESGKLDDIVKHSITLCYVLETQAEDSRPARLEAAPAQKAAVDQTKANRKGQKRGPKRMLEVPLRVAEIVTRVAPDGSWRSKVDDVCDALDEAEVPCPATWRKKERNYRSWGDCLERAIVVKAIEYRLQIARQRKKAASETLS